MAVGVVRVYPGRGEVGRVQFESQERPGAVPGEEKPSFAKLVKDFARDVNDLQFQAGQAIDLLATGGAADVHQVMIAVEQASIALDLMLEIRNRVLEGYQELIRMQV